MISDDLVSESVSRKAETFYQSLKRRRPAQDGSLGQIAVLFTQKKSKKTWFSSTEVRSFGLSLPQVINEVLVDLMIGTSSIRDTLNNGPLVT